jgi:acetylornithine deacetylase/succinyl-diaminopimelate desuccinylase-like protein
MKILETMIRILDRIIFRIPLVLSLLFIITMLSALADAQGKLSEQQILLREIYQDLIEINTTDSRGNTTHAAKAMAERLIAGGYAEEDVRVLVPEDYPRKGNLITRLRGTGARRPLLLLAHLDVVEARKEDWSFDPFKLTEQDGYFYGRGTTDDKAMAAIWIANLILYKQGGFIPDRDIIVCLTAGEEGGDFNGVQWLLSNHRNMIDAEYCINEGGGGQIKNGKYMVNEIQVSEKMYQSFRLDVKNRGGHSSLPIKDNAIYHLAEGLTRLASYDFPVKLNEGTLVFFERMSAIETGQVAVDMKALVRMPPDTAAISRLAQSPYYNALMRTTCIATMLDAGHAENALPQTATAIVNCRILPGESPEKVLHTLINVLADDNIEISPIHEVTPSPPSLLVPEIMNAIEQVTEKIWPSVPVIPTMLTGATDGLYLRNAGIPVYGVSGLFEDIDDIRAHGQDERIGVKAFYEGQEFLFLLVKELSSGK